MHILVVDFHDSYTFNLSYLLTGTGIADVDIVPHDSPQLARFVDAYEGGETAQELVVLSAGAGDPHTWRKNPVIAKLLSCPVPIWGVGLGHQLIALAAGAQLTPAAQPHHGTVAEAHHSGTGMWTRIPQNSPVARFHSWTVQEPLPARWEVTARSVDGEVLAIAGRHEGAARWGVQFQPESIDTAHGETLARNIISMARAESPQPLHGMTTPQVVEVLQRVREAGEHVRCLDDSLLEQQVMPGRDSQRGSIVALCSNDRIVGDATTLRDILSETTREDESKEFSGWIGVMNYEGDYLDFAHTVLTVSGSPAGWRVSGNDPARVLQVEKALAEETSHTAEPATATRAADTVTRLFGPDRDTYGALFDDCQQLLRAGESFELCVTDLFRIPRRVAYSPWETYLRLRQICPTHFGSYIELPAIPARNVPERTIVSASPELFLKSTPGGGIATRPMKGTAARVLDDPIVDAEVAHRLASDAKTRAENLMAIELARGEFAQVCRPGTVQVARDRVVESFATVHQLVSEVTGVLAPGKTVADAVLAAWPPASMAGAPKERSVAALQSLETAPRDIYSGIVGFITDSGDTEFSVVIRTAVFGPEEVTVGAGGAVTIDSDPAAEFAEVHHKASYVVRACLNDAALAECAPIVDSFYLAEGKAGGYADDSGFLAAHKERFVGSVKQLFGVEQAAQATKFFDECLTQLPASGTYFPQIRWMGGDAGCGVAELARPCPPRLTEIAATLSHLPDPRMFSSIKGPDMPRLAELRDEAHQRGADEMVFGDRRGRVLEGTHSAILWWEGDTLCVPPKSAVLRSTMRERVEEEMRKQGYEVQEKWLPLTELPRYRVLSVNALHGIREVTKWV